MRLTFGQCCISRSTAGPREVSCFVVRHSQNSEPLALIHANVRHLGEIPLGATWGRLPAQCHLVCARLEGGQSWPQPPFRRLGPAESRLRAKLPALQLMQNRVSSKTKWHWAPSLRRPPRPLLSPGCSGLSTCAGLQDGPRTWSSAPLCNASAAQPGPRTGRPAL
jgi:hypothetical protein